MKNKKIIKGLKALGICGLATLAGFGLVGCGEKADKDNVQANNAEIMAVYELYANNQTSKGETPLSYDDWYASIHGKSAYEIAVKNGFNGTEVEWLASLKGQDLEVATYTITLDPGKNKYFGDHINKTITVKSNEWADALNKCADSAFRGWFIKGTDIEITSHEFIGTDLELEARFDIPALAKIGNVVDNCAGVYNNGYCVASWDELLQICPDFVEGNKIMGGLESFLKQSEDDLPYFDELLVPTNITEIGDNAFMNCNNLKTIVFASPITKIGNYAFDNCASLENYVVPKFSGHIGILKHIGDFAFAGCKILKNAENIIEHRVEYIGKHAFYGVESISTIELSQELKFLGEGAFSATKLQFVYIPYDIQDATIEDCFDYSSNFGYTIKCNYIPQVETFFKNCSKIYLKSSLDEVDIPYYIKRDFVKQETTDCPGFVAWLRKS